MSEATEVDTSTRNALVLLVLTLLSTLYIGALNQGFDDPLELWRGYNFALPLMAILGCHEMGHYIAARIHRVDVSPPYFIPFPVPFLSPIGTMGAVIRMRSPIRQRNALLDIGAAGPLCGLAVAIPVLVYGISSSEVAPIVPGGLREGHSLLYVGLLWLLKGPIPSGHDIFLTPTAFAGWVGLLITMMNLVPVGQLDGGHVAFALFGKRQHTYSVIVRRSLFVVGALISGVNGYRAFRAGATSDQLTLALSSGLQWVMWGLVLTAMMRFAGGDDHPPTEPSELSPTRRAIAWLTLLLFIALFMPTWMSAG